jgi:hypothetical protein
MTNFEGTTKTKSGIECVVGAFNNCVNLYLGKVKDHWSSIPGHDWTTCSWRKNGKCVNRTRTDLDLC